MSHRRPSTLETWQDARLDQGERLLAFESWIAGQLAAKLQWPTDPAKMQRQVMQCRSLILRAVADMGRCGFLFRPKEIAAMIAERLDDIAARQARGEIHDLYAYLRITWSAYVANQSDQLRQRAMALGSHISQAARALDSIPLIVAQDLAETMAAKKAKARAKQTSRRPAADPQLDLFRTPAAPLPKPR